MFLCLLDRARAEVRAPSVRGKLRWWFRVLGGSAQEEMELFGGISDETGSSSAVIVRTLRTDSQKWKPLDPSGFSNTGYLLYFAKVSAQKPEGALPIGAAFEMHLAWRREPRPGTKQLFQLALDAFLLLGSIGLRSTRGLGAFDTAEKPFAEESFEQLKGRIRDRTRGFFIEKSPASFQERDVFDRLGAQLRSLREGYSAGAPKRPNQTPLGSSTPRQTSAVYLRPVLVGSGQYSIVVFEAPADRVLAPESRKGAPRLGGGLPPLQNAPSRARGR